ncbi:MAG: hypothetical protein Ct9H300mP19_11590 [Dehalococcoidia bacterium]|nr:MAG: hypothetical protein Ct9H300mP19_11590 [Dehalococcoidia bacterium]
MPLTEALQIITSPVIEADTTFYDLVFEEIIERLKHLIPDIEVAGPGLDIRHLGSSKALR